MTGSQDNIRLAISLRDGSLEKSVLFSLSQITSLPQDVTSVPRSSDLMTDAELQLTEDYDATALLEMLAAKKITAAKLLAAFRKRATIAQQCVSFWIFAAVFSAFHITPTSLVLTTFSLTTSSLFDFPSNQQHTKTDLSFKQPRQIASLNSSPKPSTMPKPVTSISP